MEPSRHSGQARTSREVSRCESTRVSSAMICKGAPNFFDGDLRECYPFPRNACASGTAGSQTAFCVRDDSREVFQSRRWANSFSVYNPGQPACGRVNLGRYAESKPLGSSVLRARNALQHVCATERDSVRRAGLLRVQQKRNLRDGATSGAKHVRGRRARAEHAGFPEASEPEASKSGRRGSRRQYVVTYIGEADR